MSVGTHGLPRVLQVGPVPPSLGGATPGGVASHQAYLAQAVAARGVDLTLLATNVQASAPRLNPAWTRGRFWLQPVYEPARYRDWLDPRYLRGVGPGVLVRYGRWLAGPGAGAQHGSRRTVLAHLAWYRAVFAEVRPDVLHVQHPLERVLYARTVLRQEQWTLPLVVTLHSFFDEHPAETIERVMAPNVRHADRLIAVSRSTAQQALSLGADPARLHLIRSGVDATRFQPGDRQHARRRLGLRPRAPVLLFVGNLEPRKAVDRVIRALPALGTAEDAPLLAIVGSGESAGAGNQERRLRTLVLELGLEARVRWMGRVADQDLLAWYHAADVFVLPSVSEAQGIAALEAMACGLTVVAAAVGGLVDTITDGEDGVLVDAGNPTALAQALRRSLADARLRERLGRAARATVLRDFTWERAATDTIAVYQEARETMRGRPEPALRVR